ncbi:hypothetical protein [Streptomyces prunicolor]
MATATGGTHTCDGTNGGANPSAVPTPTAALDDAARRHHFTWDGTTLRRVARKARFRAPVRFAAPARGADADGR